MKDDGYRSYVIRVRRRPGTAEGPESQTRLDVEDLLEGGTATVSGDSARLLADSLERLVDAARAKPLPEPQAPSPTLTLTREPNPRSSLSDQAAGAISSGRTGA